MLLFFHTIGYHNTVKQSLSIPLQTALIDKLVNSPGIKNFSLRVHGKSMRPFLRQGWAVLIRKLAKNEHCRIGDIAIIKDRNSFLVHRVLFKRKIKNRNGWEYFTKGDRRLVADGWIEEKNIVGRVSATRVQKVFNWLIVYYSLGLALAGKMLRRR